MRNHTCPRYVLFRRAPNVALFALLSCAAAALAAEAPLPASASPPIQAPQAILGPGDTVRVVVLENPELTTEARLSVQGTVGLPLIGEVSVGNRSTTDAATLISDSYRRGRYLRDPHVSVSLIETRSQRVLVLGHVIKPGQYPLDGSSVWKCGSSAMQGLQNVAQKLIMVGSLES